MRRTRSLRFAWAVASLAFALSRPSFAQRAAEDKAAAEALFVAGTKLMNEGKYAEACPKLAESVHVDPGVGTMLYLADCYEKTNRAASAWAQFREAEDLATKLKDQRADVARRRADKLEPTLSKLVITVTSANDIAGLELKRDGVVLGRAQWQTALPLDPGPHTITASAPQKKAWETKIDIPSTPGSTAIRVPPLLDAPAPPVTPPPPAGANAFTPEPDPHRGKTQRIAGLAVGGAGIVTAVVGLVVGLNAKATYADSNADNHCASNRCDSTGLQKRSDAFSAARTSTILSIVGGVATAGGVVLFLSAPRASKSVGVSPAVGPGAARLDFHVLW